MSKQVTICTWNINSVAVRIGHILELLKENEIDVLFLQEIKTENLDEIPFNELGYKCYYVGQKSYNGVAIISKIELEVAQKSLLQKDVRQEEARFIECYYKELDLYLVSVYVPNGTQIDSPNFIHKIIFLEGLYSHLKDKKDKRVVIGGDFNTAGFAIDVFDPIIMDGEIGFHIKERKALREIFDLNYFDTFRILNTNVKKFSRWPYQNFAYERNEGLRIDYILCSLPILKYLIKSLMLENFRSKERPSDHIPVVSTFCFDLS